MKTLKIKDTEKTKYFLSLVDSNVAMDYIDRELVRTLESIGGDDLIKNATIYELSESGLVWVTLRSDRLYDFISSHKKGSVVGTKLMLSLNKQTCFPLHGYFDVSISIDLYCDLPDEDLEMFETMGKIHRNITPARIEKSVFCEI